MSSDTVDDGIAFEAAGKAIAPCQAFTVHKNWWEPCPECSESVHIVIKARQVMEVLILLSAD